MESSRELAFIKAISTAMGVINNAARELSAAVETKGDPELAAPMMERAKNGLDQAKHIIDNAARGIR